jgi:lysyl-tRNA synthetase class 2
MFLTDNYSIKEVLAFPFMKEDVSMKKEKLAAEEVGIQPVAEEGIRESSNRRPSELYLQMVSAQVDDPSRVRDGWIIDR